MSAKTTAEYKLLFWSKKSEGSECLLWTGSVDRCGYGKFMSADMRGETLVHRAAYKIWCGAIPDGLEIDHKCRVRNCINPSHLRAVTHAKNVSFADYKTTHRNSVKTHCKRGHEFDRSNTIIEFSASGAARKCRECRKIARNKRYIKAKLMAAQGLPIREVKA